MVEAVILIFMGNRATVPSLVTNQVKATEQHFFSQLLTLPPLGVHVKNNIQRILTLKIYMTHLHLSYLVPFLNKPVKTHIIKNKRKKTFSLLLDHLCT